MNDVKTKYNVNGAIKEFYKKNPDKFIKVELGIELNFIQKIFLKLAFIGVK